MKPPKLKTREQRIEWWAGYVVAHFGADPATARQHAERIVDRAAERRSTTSKPLTRSRNAPELSQ
jgi:hypothetical protein